jgi:glycosyltransferase involved in cell wall biosynthesis
MINIAFISTFAYNCFFPGSAKQSGGHTRIYQISRKLATMPDYRVNCIVGDFGQPNIVYKDNVRLVKAPVDNPYALLKVLSILRNLKVDIYIDFIASPRLSLLYLLQRLYQKKYIFLTGSDSDVTKKYKKLENTIFYWFYYLGLKNADAVISQIPKHVEILRQLHRIPSYLVLSPYFEIKQSVQKKKDYILWVGRAATYKNPDGYMALAERFPNEKFIMICNDSPFDKNCKGLIRNKLAKLKNVKYISYVPYPEISNYMERAKILVNTSTFEGFPNTFIEAASKHTPILSLNVDPNGMFSNYRGGICCGGNFDYFLKAFKILVGNEEKRVELGKNAFDYAQMNHQLDDAVKHFDRIIKRVLKG